MKICVFVRPVHQPGFPLLPADGGQVLEELPGYRPTANALDEQALETALALRDDPAFAGRLSVTLCSAGAGEACQRVLRDLLACGPDDAVWIDTPPGDPDGEGVARTLAQVFRVRAFDLALFGACDSDTAAGRTGPMFSAVAGIPYLGSVVQLRRGGTGALEVTRRQGRIREEVRLQLPAGLGVLRGPSLRYPSFWGKRRARHARVDSLRLPAPGSRVERLKLTGGKPRRTLTPREDASASSADRMRRAFGVSSGKSGAGQQIRGTPEEAARAIREALEREKLL